VLQSIDQIISEEEFNALKIQQLSMNFDEDPEKVFLSLETMRYRFASMYDPLLAMNTSKVDPLPHQIEAVYGYVLKKPRIRFMIADDPGAGKTIMAGLIIKELKIRHLVNRILIVVPGHLKDQWRRELKDRFEEIFILVGREYINALYGQNIWLRENQIITSIDFSKRENVLPSIASAHFDLIIVDEAHKMSAYRYSDKVSKTGRYRLGEVLSRNCEHLLFLTATPHKGDPENFRLFLDLLEPGFFATNEMVEESIRNNENPLFIRRVKEDLKDFDGKPLFLPRHVKTIAFRWGAESQKEKELYNELSKYVITQYNRALSKDKRRNIAFAIVILQRRFASSTYALLRSLERRKKRLEEYLNNAEKRKEVLSKIPDSTFDFEAIEDMDEETRWKEEEIWETLSVAANREELRKEIQTINVLIEKAKDIIRNEEEVKLKEFKKALETLSGKFAEPADKKVLVFTEARDTLEYLEKKVQSWGCRMNTIHGGMKLKDRIKENLGESLATRYIDYTRIKEMQQIAREHRLIPEYTESFFERVFVKENGKLRKRKDGFLAVDSVPHTIRSVAGDDNFKKSFGDLLKKYPKVTFDKELAFRNPDSDFVCFGHPLFEAVLEFIENNYSDSLVKGATFIDPDGRYDGYIVFYEGEIDDGTGSVAGKRLFSFYIKGNDVMPVDASIIWDLAASRDAYSADVDIDDIKNGTTVSAIELLENYKAELSKERIREAVIKKKYGDKSFVYLILNLDKDLIGLYKRKENSENVDLAIRNKEERKSRYVLARDELKNFIEKEKTLTMNSPKFVGIIRVMTRKNETDMQTDFQLEQVGMDIAMEYERNHK